MSVALSAMMTMGFTIMTVAHASTYHYYSTKLEVNGKQVSAPSHIEAVDHTATPSGVAAN